MRVISLLALCAATASAHFAPRPQNGWVLSRELRGAYASQQFQVRVALTQPRRAELEETVLRVSDPKSADYGKHLTAEQVAQLVSLPEEQRKEVMEHLGCNTDDVSCEVGVHRDYVLLSTTVQRAEALFNVTLQSYEHPDSAKLPGAPKTIYRSTSEPVFCERIAAAVEFVLGVSDFPILRSHRIRSVTKTKAGSWPGDNVDPGVLKKQYQITATASSRTSAGCAEFEGEQFKQTDIDAFTDTYSLPRNTVLVHGPNSGGYEGEGTLDVEYLIGAAPDLNVTFWSIPWTTFDADLLTWAQQVQGTKNPPLVHSISWGSGESGSAGYDLPVMVRTNTEFQKMGAQGISVLIASGDDGTGNTASFFGCDKFDANWPASSPWSTAVGGTYLQSGTEIGWGDSGGGFSNLWPRPSWQDDAIKAYLKQPNLPAQKYWNASGRAIPDVAALATNYQVVSGSKGNAESEAGTSASTPVFAALIALVNDQRIQDGKSPLGFLNPALYQLGNLGFDVVSGNNKASGCPTGFPATPGWDAITGLGTPILANLYKLGN